MWNDHYYGGVGTRSDLTTDLINNQKAASCQALIAALKEKSPGRLKVKNYHYISRSNPIRFQTMMC